MQINAATLAGLINAEVEGNPEVLIYAPAKIEEAGPGTITFLGNDTYEHYVYSTQASALLVKRDFTPREALPAGLTLLRVDDVYQSVSDLLERFQDHAAPHHGPLISDSSCVHAQTTIGKDVRIGELTVVSEGAEIGEGTILESQVTIGRNARVGKNCHVHPGARILRDCVVGDDCIINANAVIGGDGFGFAPDPETGAYKKIPQIGNVVLHDRVEVGAGTTIDRATMGSTVIRAGVKLDNLIQIAHNVEIGENTAVAALAGVAGSAKIGKNCMIGGQVGINGHKKVGDGVAVHPQTGIISDVEAGRRIVGSPHLSYREYFKSYAIFRKLPRLMRELERRLKALEN